MNSLLIDRRSGNDAATRSCKQDARRRRQDTRDVAGRCRDGPRGRRVGDGRRPCRAGGPGRFDLLITDLKMPRMTGIELLAEARRLRPEMPVVLMTAFATVATAVEAMKLGAYDYIQKPFDGDEIKLLVDRTLEHSRLVKENAALRSMAEQQLAPRPLIGTGAVDERGPQEDRAGRPKQRHGAGSAGKAAPARKWSPGRSMPPRRGATSRCWRSIVRP